MRHVIFGVLAAFARRGRVVLVSSHRAGLAFEFADNVLALQAGHVVFTGRSEDLPGSVLKDFLPLRRPDSLLFPQDGRRSCVPVLGLAGPGTLGLSCCPRAVTVGVPTGPARRQVDSSFNGGRLDGRFTL